MTGEKGRPSDGQSISRAVAVLRAVADKPGSSLGEIAKATGLARSTVQRLVGALNAEGLLIKTFGQQGVYLGMELARLGAKVEIDARALLRPLMEELHGRIAENIDLTTIDHDRVIVVEQIASNENIRVISYVGKQHPVHCTANGKAHLSQMSRAEAEAFLAGPLEVFTPQTITDQTRLLDQVAAYREAGLFIDREEYSDGACAVGVALPQIGGRSLALAIAMPSARFQKREEEVKAALLDFRRAVQAEFGASI
ncbi:IclR family transcriptional regulator [Poseidonocella sp. HB161398]|uniref:IclR family transcriptional regulator n=1 Tax=Poseidonocella sp. HB161398 TaxID=2320855 RepID=UPI00148628A1|nr:IclR family transcriptional regulator [Poseidonocella sp. HB161398]